MKLREAVTCFTEANELGYADVNPAHRILKRVLPAKSKRVRNEPDPLNHQDLDRFLEMAWAKLPVPYPLILEAYIKKMRKETMVEGEFPSLYLFTGITQRMIQRAMQRACKAARLRVRNPHDLRHSYATMLLMDHYSPAYVQKQLGHSSISITVDIYGHWIPG